MLLYQGGGLVIDQNYAIRFSVCWLYKAGSVIASLLSLKLT